MYVNQSICWSPEWSIRRDHHEWGSILFVIHLVDTFLTKMSGLETKTGIIFPAIVATTLISIALPYCIASFDGVSFSHSQMCDSTCRQTCRTHYFFSKKHFVHFSEHIFCSIHQLTCLHHVQRITATFFKRHIIFGSQGSDSLLSSREGGKRIGTLAREDDAI